MPHYSNTGSKQSFFKVFVEVRKTAKRDTGDGQKPNVVKFIQEKGINSRLFRKKDGFYSCILQAFIPSISG